MQKHTSVTHFSRTYNSFNFFFFINSVIYATHEDVTFMVVDLFLFFSSHHEQNVIRSIPARECFCYILVHAELKTLKFNKLQPISLNSKQNNPEFKP